MKAWIKSLGRGDAPIPSSGLAQIRWVTHDIGFPVDPAVRPGDRLVLYASGYGRIFGVVEVHLPPYLDNREAPWSYRCETRPRLVIDDLGRAPDLADANVTRDLRRSIRQQSHIALRLPEYDAAVAALEAAVDVGAGDLREPSIAGRI